MTSNQLPDYYGILDVSASATDIQIKTAYKKAALKWHPDRVAVDSPERSKRTKKFQQINDAYFTLSEPKRRSEYDLARRFHTGSFASADDKEDEKPSTAAAEGEDEESADEEIPRPSGADKASGGGGGGFFNWFAGFGGRSAKQTAGDGSAGSHADADAQFGRAFEEMMHDDLTEGEGEARRPNGRFWAVAGTLSGAVLGFIVANVPGAAAGGAVGNRLGTLRDKHKQSVYATFQELPQTERNKLLTELAAKLFAGALS